MAQKNSVKDRYPFKGRDDNSLEEIELEEKKQLGIQEKIKEIRQNFSQAVISGRHIGNGKVVLEFYDDLVKLWCGSPATESLTCGISSKDINLPSCSSISTSSSFNDDTNKLDEDNNDKNIVLTNRLKKSRKVQIQYHSLSTINVNILNGSSVWL